jgi:hypothetical protein
MKTVDHIISLLGGSAEIARETGFPLSTIESWRKPNFIPDWRREPLLGLAFRKGVSLSTTDFPTKAARTSIASPERAAA